jgi:hypothetical protein
MKGISSEKQRDLILTLGTHNRERPLSPIEVAELLNITISSGSSINDVAKELLLQNTSMIPRFRRLLKLSPEIKHLVDWSGKSSISFTTASEIARLKTFEEQESVGKATIESRLTKIEVIQIIEAKNKSGKPLCECIKEIITMRPRIIKRYLFIGAIRSPEVQDRLSCISQKERDEFLTKVVNLNIPNLPSWDGHLGKDRFTLIGDEDLNQILNKLSTDFSVSINNCLEMGILQ